MSIYRNRLPQSERLFITDGGLETVLIFQNGIELNCFAAVDLMRRPNGPNLLREYFKPYIEIASLVGTGLVLETPHLARQPGLGGPHRLSRSRRTYRCQPTRLEAYGRNPHGERHARHTHRGLRLYRSSRRRL